MSAAAERPEERRGQSGGRHAAPRHAAPRPTEPVRLDTSRVPPVEPLPQRGGVAGLFWLSLGITAAAVAWGYLVYLAIDFGTAARSGEQRGWFLLALATVGAIACLFIGMVLVARFVQRVRGASEPPPPPPTPGGRRASR